jgi:uncharacterized protein
VNARPISSLNECRRGRTGRRPPFGWQPLDFIENRSRYQDEREHRIWQRDMAPEGGARFENLVACQLLEYCHFVEDSEGHAMELRFLRDTDEREVDFVVLKDRKPLFAVECKSGERSVSPAICSFAARTAIPRFYQVHLGDRHRETGAATVLPFPIFCCELSLP